MPASCHAGYPAGVSILLDDRPCDGGKRRLYQGLAISDDGLNETPCSNLSLACRPFAGKARSFVHHLGILETADYVALIRPRAEDRAAISSNMRGHLP